MEIKRRSTTTSILHGKAGPGEAFLCLEQGLELKRFNYNSHYSVFDIIIIMK